MALPRDIAMSGPRPKTIADEQEIGMLRLAMGHAMWRNNLVAKVFCYLSVMQAAGKISTKSKVLISPSKLQVPQDFQSTENNQAAHYLPGFVAIQDPSGKLEALWQLVSDPRIKSEIETLFRSTQDLHASYNRADSAAEARRLFGPPGLKQVFGQCCQRVIEQPPIKSNHSDEVFIVVNRSSVTSAYARWAQGSIEAYRFASSRKTTSIDHRKPANVLSEPRRDPLVGLGAWTEGDLNARRLDQERIISGRKATVQEFSDQESFLRAYANATSENFPLSEAVIGQIERPFSAHKMPDWYVGNNHSS
jgi:hypothetical protein